MWPWYTQKEQFEIHQGVLTREKPCTCDICGKAFSVNASLAVYQKIHAGEKVADRLGRLEVKKQSGTLLMLFKSHGFLN